jgi:hypothetical protein
MLTGRRYGQKFTETVERNPLRKVSRYEKTLYGQLPFLAAFARWLLGWQTTVCAARLRLRNDAANVAAHWFTSVRNSRLMHFAAGGENNNRLEQSR